MRKDLTVGDAALDISTDPPTLVMLAARSADGPPLPYDANDQRYRCLDCREVLILRQRRHATRFTSNFGHYGGADCAAPLIRRQETAEHLAAKSLIAEWLRGKNVPARIEPGPYLGVDGVRAFRPDVSAWPDERAIVGIEYQRSPLDVGESADREAAYRAYAGPDRLHLWIFSVSPNASHYASVGTIQVAGHDGRPRTHRRVVPTRDQIELVAAGAAVCWLDVDSGWLYVPYSGTEFLFDKRGDEQWASRGKGSNREWRAGFPELDPAASWWALAPTRLQYCSVSADRTRLLTPAVDRAVRAVLDDEQPREQRRREAARQRRRQTLAEAELLAKATAGEGEHATALHAELQALTAAAAHEHAAEMAEAAASREHAESQRMYRLSGELAREAGRNPVALAVRGRRRSGVQDQQRQAQKQAEQAAERAGELRAQAAASRAKAGEAHRSGHGRRAGKALGELETGWTARLRAAIDKDVSALHGIGSGQPWPL